MAHIAWTYRSQVQVVENLHAILPRIRISVLLHAFFVESIDLCDLARLMISSQKGDTIRVPGFQTKQKLERFDTIVSSIDEITHKDIICTGRLSANFEQLKEIEKLPMNVTAYLQNVDSKINAMPIRCFSLKNHYRDRSADELNIGLFHQLVLNLKHDYISMSALISLLVSSNSCLP